MLKTTLAAGQRGENSEQDVEKNKVDGQDEKQQTQQSYKSQQIV